MTVTNYECIKQHLCIDLCIKPTMNSDVYVDFLRENRYI